MIPDHKLVLVPTKTEEEANYLCGVLNSCIVRFFAASYTIGTQFSTHLFEYIHIPSWDETDKRMRAIAQAAREAGQCRRESDLTSIEERLERNVAELLGMTENELEATRASFIELTKVDIRGTTGSGGEDIGLSESLQDPASH